MKLITAIVNKEDSRNVCNELLKKGEEVPKTGAHITWVIDGKVAAEEDYLKGTMPSFKGSTDKAPDDNYRYTFTGWSPEGPESSKMAPSSA